MDKRNIKQAMAMSPTEVAGWAVTMALQSAVKRGTLSQEAMLELANAVDFAYVALMRGDVLVIDQTTGELTAEPRKTDEWAENNNDTLRIGDDE